MYLGFNNSWSKVPSFRVISSQKLEQGKPVKAFFNFRQIVVEHRVFFPKFYPLRPLFLKASSISCYGFTYITKP